MSSDRNNARSGLSIGTLAIASASSLVAAIVGSKLWGAGTLIGAALTPVVVAVVSEALRKPQEVIVTARQTRAAGRYDPVAEGRRGVAEGDLPRARSQGSVATTERRVHRAGPGGVSGRDPRTPAKRDVRSRRRLALAIATGLVAFVVAGVVLTGSELVLGNSVVSSSKRTTYIPVGTGKTSSTTDSKTTTTDTGAKTTKTDTTETTTTPDQQSTSPSQTTPTAPQPNTVPGAPTPAQTAPAPSPPPNQPVPAPTTSTPAPTP